MRIKKGLKIRQVGKTYILVDSDGGHTDLTYVYRLNAPSASLWTAFRDKDFSEEDATTWLCEAYEVEWHRAWRDVGMLLRQWESFGLLT